jgi:hypothetical protein
MAIQEGLPLLKERKKGGIVLMGAIVAYHKVQVSLLIYFILIITFNDLISFLFIKVSPTTWNISHQ